MMRFLIGLFLGFGMCYFALFVPTLVVARDAKADAVSLANSAHDFCTSYNTMQHAYVIAATRLGVDTSNQTVSNCDFGGHKEWPLK
jgi:hypothetical protein